ncbi:hypothetical protein SAMN05421820_12317 [Pedobacter steynii]|uniref:DUF2116 family Zn-ribbon domain-containing protein n=1 Tax=Pedobacter steynii TaxID=430522 RepID=A0A1H0MGL0_9SPHI|nr:hypothetical protein [Pedobacter steynii]NQX43647.1 hypothetical protein [Pedobacter steynii]SDO79569.1 hypothetical protein SAMN05421820_12317 [Pedobacter steynii]
MERFCLDCNLPLKGRADQKFCSQHCRNNYNNDHKDPQQDPVKAINKILRKNREILKKLNPDGKTKISKQHLLATGFRFDYFTHLYQNKKGNTYHFCYEYGYLSLENEEYLLVTEYKGLMISL